MTKYKTFIIRVVSLFIYTGLGTFGLSTGLGIEPLKAAILSAVIPLLLVLRTAAKGFMNDGTLTQAEMDEAINSGKKTAE